ncbi:dUTP diphosphatase [Desulfovibrio sp. OttesenSCG-928-C06]|nr:dUTP diphosphatase [Desulfovibrio sp. OttesenSCG-928-C06]
MNDINIKIKFYNGAAELYSAPGSVGPVPATPGSAGFDLRVNHIGEGEESFTIPPGGRAAIHSGICVEPSLSDVAGFVYSRSGLGAVQGLTVAQGVGLIDPDYRGEIVVFLLNTSGEPKTVKRGDRVAQLVFQPFYRAVFEPVDELGTTERGAGGFGHTGK